MTCEEFQTLCHACVAASPSCRGVRLAFEKVEDFGRERGIELSRGHEVARSGRSIGEVRQTARPNVAITSPSDIPFIIANMATALEDLVNGRDEERTRHAILAELRNAGCGC